MAHTEGIWDEDPINEIASMGVARTAHDRPVNAYGMGYYDGLYGLSVAKGMNGSERYMRGYNAGMTQWEHYLAMARGQA